MDYSYDKKVGAKIHGVRVSNGLTQEDLAAKLQMNGYWLTRGSIAKMETGQRHIYLYELKAIRDIFNVSFDDLLV